MDAKKLHLRDQRGEESGYGFVHPNIGKPKTDIEKKAFALVDEHLQNRTDDPKRKKLCDIHNTCFVHIYDVIEMVEKALKG